jgi:hypothetical protein
MEPESLFPHSQERATCNAETQCRSIVLPYGLLSDCMQCSHGRNIFKAQTQGWQLLHQTWVSVCSFAKDLPASSVGSNCRFEGT